MRAITDMLDGYLARKFNEVTELGKIIDPLADKIAIGVIILKLYLIGIIPRVLFYNDSRKRFIDIFRRYFYH